MKFGTVKKLFKSTVTTALIYMAMQTGITATFLSNSQQVVADAMTKCEAAVASIIQETDFMNEDSVLVCAEKVSGEFQAAAGENAEFESATIEKQVNDKLVTVALNQNACTYTVEDATYGQLLNPVLEKMIEDDGSLTLTTDSGTQIVVGPQMAIMETENAVVAEDNLKTTDDFRIPENTLSEEELMAQYTSEMEQLNLVFSDKRDIYLANLANVEVVEITPESSQADVPLENEDVEVIDVSNTEDTKDGETEEAITETEETEEESEEASEEEVKEETTEEDVEIPHTLPDMNDASQIPELSDSDIELLCKVTMAEAGNQGTQGQELVASVVLNRLVSPNYPNTMEGVISAPSQFSTWANGSVQSASPSQEVRDAVNNVLESGTITQATYFTRVDANKWHERDLIRQEDCGWTHKEHCFYNTPAEAEELELRNGTDKTIPFEDIEEEYV